MIFLISISKINKYFNFAKVIIASTELLSAKAPIPSLTVLEIFKLYTLIYSGSSSRNFENNKR